MADIASTPRANAVYNAVLDLCATQLPDYCARRLTAALADWQMAPTDPVSIGVIEACIEHAQRNLYEEHLPFLRADYKAILNTAQAAGY